MATPISDDSFVLEEAIEDDLSAVVDVNMVAFANDGFSPFMGPDEDMHAWWLRNFTDGLRKPSGRVFIIREAAGTDKKGKIVAFSRWEFPPHVDDEKGTNPLPPTANKGLCEELFTNIAKNHSKYVDENTAYVFLQCTLPAYERRGLASRLLRRGLEVARARGLRVYIEGSPSGAPLYERLGWREVDSYRPVDVSKHVPSSALPEGEGDAKELKWICAMWEEGKGGEKE